MKELMPFEYENHEVRVIQDENGDPWWFVKDVCDVLDLSNTTESVRFLDDDEKSTFRNSEGCPGPERIIISESGLYTLILRSNKPEAKKFRRWITHEVLPAIRRTGYYAAPAAQPVASLVPITREFRAAVGMARSLGFKGKNAIRSANTVVLRLTGTDCLELFDAKDQFEGPEELEGTRLATSGALVLGFVESECELGAGYAVSTDELYGRYSAFAEDNSEPVLSRSVFFKVIYGLITVQNSRPRVDGQRVCSLIGLRLKKSHLSIVEQ